MRRTRLFSLTAGVLATGLVLAGCGEDDGDGDDTAAPEDTEAEEEAEEPADEETDEEEADDEAAAQDWSQCDMREGAGPMPDPEGTGDDETSLTIGIFTGWDESYATAHLFRHLLEDQGYSVDFTELEAGPTFGGVAEGDIDLTTDGWLPLTHADYLEQHGDSLVSLGCWYDNAKLTIAVNEDAPIQSLDELNENADAFGGQLFGIEPGAGLTQATEEQVIPTYGLDDISFEIASTPAMLTELRQHIANDEDVVVTLWRPHWAYDAYPIRDLEDPEGALGGQELIYNFGRPGFDEDFANVAQMAQNLVMSDEDLASLENLMFSDEFYGGDDHEAAVADWVDENPDFVEALKAGEL